MSKPVELCFDKNEVYSVRRSYIILEDLMFLYRPSQTSHDGGV